MASALSPTSNQSIKPLATTTTSMSMERPHRVLEKKLHELEVRFTDLFFPDHDDPRPATDTADHQTLSREIQARVDFLQNLLAIEKDCHPQGHAPSHLLNLEHRLHGLNTAFRDWMAGPDDHVRPNTDQVLPDQDITVDCSCTRSCFSSDDDDDNDKARDDASDIADSDCFELDIKEDPMVLDVNTSDNQQKVEGEQLETREYNRPKFRLLSRILALAGAAAAVSVGVTVLISQVLGGFQDEVFLVPT